MGLFTIISLEAEGDYKPLVYNLNVTRGSHGIELKTVIINIYKSYITGDNEETSTLDDVGSGSVDYTGNGNPVGLPVSFTPGSLTIDSAPVVTLGTGAINGGSITLEDSAGNPLSYPATESITLNATNIGFVLKISIFTTGTTTSKINIPITVQNSSETQSISKSILINILNDS